MLLDVLVHLDQLDHVVIWVHLGEMAPLDTQGVLDRKVHPDVLAVQEQLVAQVYLAVLETEAFQEIVVHLDPKDEQVLPVDLAHLDLKDDPVQKDQLVDRVQLDVTEQLVYQGQ